ncbi:hypothetical protein [Streptomyces sp. C1-2]|uniref:hypothetical protein n=1 Tax=Streptomyces sp. C1-2 TaxID=2720022 RepID=UPI0014324371|nr:hypothetical protein [Streptomyces sp. C1-2]NJP74563.1 hypothetical protein [Streptomyces sp. C1-2]
MHQPYPPRPPHQPPQRPTRLTDRKGFRFGCLPAIVIVWLLIIGAVLTHDSDDDKPAAKPKAKTSAKPNRLDDAGQLACTDFARGYKAAQTQHARIELADKVNEWAQQSDTDGIADNAVVLARGSEGSAGAWQIGADSFAQSCLDAGWKP